MFPDWKEKLEVYQHLHWMHVATEEVFIAIFVLLVSKSRRFSAQTEPYSLKNVPQFGSAYCKLKLENWMNVRLRIFIRCSGYSFSCDHRPNTMKQAHDHDPSCLCTCLTNLNLNRMAWKTFRHNATRLSMVSFLIIRDVKLFSLWK